MDQPLEFEHWIKISDLGSGSFGVVTLWKNEQTNDFVAIKKCKIQKASNLSPKQKERWYKEVEFMKSVNHKNIVQFKNVDLKFQEFMKMYNPSKLPILYMEYCKKGNLRRFLLNEPKKFCGVEEEAVRFIIKDIANGLRYLHSQNITHRDIKPENIVLQHTDDRSSQTICKIIDLGYAKKLDNDTQSMVGTLHYLAPEIFYNKYYDKTVDYWSFGVMVFEIACGLLPFQVEMPDYERFERIKSKGSDDISIYMSYSGAITNATTIRKENFLTGCFKEYIEKWLKTVLQFDSTKRDVVNNIDTLDYIDFILNVRIVKVFSVYTQEYYSYQIDKETRLDTLKTWISRDIKVPPRDLLLLFYSNYQINCFEDNFELLENLLINEDVIIYVYKKGEPFMNAPNITAPNLIKELYNFKAKFQYRYVFHLFRQTLFYLYSLNSLTRDLKQAFFSFMKYLDKGYKSLEVEYRRKTMMFYGIILNFKEINSQIENKSKINMEYLALFKTQVEALTRREETFRKQFKLVDKIMKVLKDEEQHFPEKFHLAEMNELFDKMNSKSFFEKDSKETRIIAKIHEVVFDTVKIVYKNIKFEQFKEYSKDLVFLQSTIESLKSWINGDFSLGIFQLLETFSFLKGSCQAAILEQKEINSDKSGSSESLEIIEENLCLRSQFTNLIDNRFLNQQFVATALNLLKVSMD